MPHARSAPAWMDREPKSQPYDKLVYTSMRGIREPNIRARWLAAILSVVNMHAPGARVAGTCTVDKGYTRFLFSGVGIGAIGNVQSALEDHFGTGCVHGIVTTHGDAGTDGAGIRDERETLFVDVVDPSALDAKPPEPLPWWCNLYVFALVVGFAVFVWSVARLVKHYEGYHSPFVHQIDAARAAWSDFVD